MSITPGTLLHLDSNLCTELKLELQHLTAMQVNAVYAEELATDTSCRGKLSRKKKTVGKKTAIAARGYVFLCFFFSLCVFFFPFTFYLLLPFLALFTIVKHLKKIDKITCDCSLITFDCDKI